EEAKVVIVFASTRAGLRGQGVTAFLVPMDTPGITRTARADSLGVRGLGCMDRDLDIAVSDDQVLGDVDQGFRLAMWALQGGRVAIAAQALGIGEAALDEALAYAKQREQFGQPIANYQAIQWMLADMATELAAARMLTLKAAAAKDTQEKSAFEASMAKLAASEAAHKAADKAMQILASAGYRRLSVAELSARAAQTAEGRPLAAAFDALDAFVATYLRTMDAPGLTLAIADRGSVLRLAAYGVSDRERKLDVDRDQLFEIGSITK